MSPRSIELDSLAAQAGTLPLLNFFTYFFFRDNMPIDMNMLLFLLGKFARTAAKTMVVDRKTRRHWLSNI